MKNILVSGGSRGIGLEFARQYLRRGHRVFAASRSPEKASDLQKLKAGCDDRLFICQLDVSVEDSRHRLFRRLSEQIGNVDILINNAGIASGNEKRRHRFGDLAGRTGAVRIAASPCGQIIRLPLCILASGRSYAAGSLLCAARGGPAPPFPSSSA